MTPPWQDPPTPIERLGIWLATNAQLADDCSNEDVEEVINRLSGAGIGEHIEEVFGEEVEA